MRRGVLLAAAGGAVVLLSTSATGMPWTAERTPGGGTPDDGFALLEQAARAAQVLSYHGTQMVSFWSDSGSTSALIEVTHVGGEGLLLRVAATPQSPGGAVYHDEDGDVPDVVGFAKGTLALLASHYETAVEGDGDVAGRDAEIVAVRRPGQSPTARFWIDRATHLPLRREVLDGAGRTVRESAFIQLSVGQAHVAPAVAESAGAMPAVAGSPVATDVLGLRKLGWTVPDALSSGLELYDARILGERRQRVLQLTYADGVSTVSVFEQHGRLDTGSLSGWQKVTVAGHKAWVQGAFPRRVVLSGGGMVFTVVADCPQATLDDVVGTLPRRNPGPGIATRLGHGVHRVGSWLNPFA
jgi:sigma-E factor negative regulatory protein RseB